MNVPSIPPAARTRPVPAALSALAALAAFAPLATFAVAATVALAGLATPAAAQVSPPSATTDLSDVQLDPGTLRVHFIEWTVGVHPILGALYRCAGGFPLLKV